MKIKKILFLSFWIIYQTNLSAENRIKICLTGKIELTLPSYKESFLNSVNLALSQNKLSNMIIIQEYFYNNDSLSPLRAYENMLKEHCSAIIGFEYLSDLLLIAKEQKNENIPIFTSYSSSNSGDIFPKNIFITMPTYDYQAKKMINFLHKRFGKINNLLIITEVNRIDLVKYKNAYINLLKDEKSNYNTFDFLADDSHLEQKLKQFLLGKNFEYVFVLSGAIGSTKIVDYMNDHKIKFIGTENFGTSTTQSLYLRLHNKDLSAFIVRHIDYLKMNIYQKKFLIDYKYKFKSEPIQIAMYPYDSINMILKTIEQEKFLTVENIKKINFNGITGIVIKNHKFYRSNDYVILSIGKEGFKLEE